MKGENKMNMLSKFFKLKEHKTDVKTEKNICDFDVLNFNVNDHIVMDYEINLKGICQKCKEGNIKNGTKR